MMLPGCPLGAPGLDGQSECQLPVSSQTVTAIVSRDVVWRSIDDSPQRVFQIHLTRLVVQNQAGLSAIEHDVLLRLQQRADRDDETFSATRIERPTADVGQQTRRPVRHADAARRR